MENQVSGSNQNPQQIGQNPINQSTKIPEGPKANYFIIGGIILACFVVFGLGGYILGKRSSTYQSNLNNFTSESNPTAVPESSTPTTVPTNQQVDNLPPGWSYEENGECGVKFAIPPKQIPYYYPVDVNRSPSVNEKQVSGRFWNFPRGSASPDLLSKVLIPPQKYKQAITMYASGKEGGGYIYQAVAVSCISNNKRFADNNALIESLTTELDKYNKLTGEKGMGASTYTIKNNTPTIRWGKSVVDLTVTEDTNDVRYTMFVTLQYIYEIKVFGAASDSFVKETARKIFDNLVF